MKVTNGKFNYYNYTYFNELNYFFLCRLSVDQLMQRKQKLILLLVHLLLLAQFT